MKSYDDGITTAANNHIDACERKNATISLHPTPSELFDFMGAMLEATG